MFDSNKPDVDLSGSIKDDGVKNDLRGINPEDALNLIVDLKVELSRKDGAIKELVLLNESVRKQAEQEVKASVRQLLLPLLDTIEASLPVEGKRTLKLVRSGLEDITSPFVSKLNKEVLALTPREIEVCNLVRSGYSTKEAARYLNVSVETVRTQRRSIRRKLGVTSKKVNLYTLLNNLEF